MSKIRLSSLRERIPAAVSLAALLLVFLYAVLKTRGNTGLLIAVIIGGIILLAMFVFYALTVFTVACTMDKDSDEIIVSGLMPENIKTAGAAKVGIRRVETGTVSPTNIVFYGEDDTVIAELGTFFTAKRGNAAEKAAMAIAEALSIDFYSFDGEEKTPSEDTVTDYDALDDKR